MANRHITISRTRRGYTCEIYNDILAESRKTLTSQITGREYYSFTNLVRVLSGSELEPLYEGNLTYEADPKLSFRRSPIRIPPVERWAIQGLVGRLNSLHRELSKKENAIQKIKRIICV